MVTPDEIKKVIRYDPESGQFYWSKNSGRRKAGERAGYRMQHGYEEIKVLGKRWTAHRLAWFIMTGVIPENQIDHINGIRYDNRWINLRLANQSENNMNRCANNTLGVKNVYLHKPTGTYNVKLYVNGVCISFGYYADLELAELVATEAREKYHKQFARHD